VHGRVRTGLCSYIRLSASHCFSSTATAYLAGLHNDTALSIHWGVHDFGRATFGGHTFYKGAFVAWRLIVWDILFLPFGHVWVFLGLFCTVMRVACSAALALSDTFLSLQRPWQAYVYFPNAQPLLVASTCFASTPSSLRGPVALEQ
jgi:hypothetical protein